MRRGESIPIRSAKRELALAGVPLLVGIFAFAQSYLRWLDPIVDAGRDLYIPEQLRFGASLYRDVVYFYPPLTPWLLAGITTLTGSSLQAYVAIGTATALLTAALLWSIARPLAGPYAAGAVLLLFFSYSMAGVGGWGCNYFFPYAHAATFGMLFLLAATALIVREHPVPAMYFLVAASWTKVEYATIGLLLVGYVWWTGESTSRRPRRALYHFLLVSLVTVGAAIGRFGIDRLRENVLPPSLIGGAAARWFYAHVTGAASWRANLLMAARGAATIAAFALLLHAWNRFPRARALVLVGLGIATWLLADGTFFRAWTLLQVGLLPFALRRPRQPLALLLLFSIAASLRVYLNVVPEWYGFVLVLPVELLMAYVLFAWLPERGLYDRRVAFFWLPLIAILSAVGLSRAHATYANAVEVQTPRGTYFDTSRERAAAVSGLIAHLTRTRATELVVMPEGLAINYLAKIPTPLRHYTFTPAELEGDEPTILAELKEKRPTLIAIVPRDVTEFGRRGFGVDYARNIVAWLRANYVVEQQFGGTVLLRTRNDEHGTRNDEQGTMNTER